MPVRSPEAPQPAVDLLQSALQGIAVSGQFRLRALRRRRAEDITFDQPHPIYNLEARGIADDVGLAAAVFSGWRFLLTEQGEAIGAAEILINQQTGTFYFAGAGSGPYVASTAAALRDLPARFAAESREWTIRLLRVPALYVWALWFHELLGTDEQFLPLAPVPGYLEEHRLYSWAEISRILMPPAQSRLMDDFSRGNSI